MVQFIVKNASDFDKQLRAAVNIKVARIIANSESFLLETAEMLRDQFASSTEFLEIQTKLVGEFGFTPEEVVDLSKILDLLVPNNEITKLSLKVSPNRQEAMLEWVDIAKLKQHQLAKHDLTKLNLQTGNFELTDVISWVEWLEDGAIVRNYVFDGEQTGRFSRSGEGIMRRVSGGFWEFAPTKVFEKIARRLKDSDIARGFGVVIRKSRSR